MKKEYLLYDLSELPDNMTLDDVIKKYKEEKIILVNAGQTVNSKVIEIEVNEEEIENETKKRTLDRINKFRDFIRESLNRRGSIFTVEFQHMLDMAQKEALNK